MSATARKSCRVEDFKLPIQGTFRSHPGGQEHLKTAEQSECPVLLFLVYHMGCDLDGRIAGALKAQGLEMPQYGELFAEVHALVRKVKEEHRKQHWVFVAWSLIITAGLFTVFPWFLLCPSVAASIFASFLFEVYFLNIFHTRHHNGGKLYDIPWLDRLTAPLYEVVDNIWGYHPAAWRKNHHVYHHMNTNANCDPDLPAMYPLIRLFQSQERRWFHVAQTFYWPLLLPFSVTRFPLQNVFVHGGPWGYFVLWIVLMWVLPCLHGLPGLRATLLVQSLTGLTITTKFAVSHSHTDLVAHSSRNAHSLLTTKHTKMDAWMANQIEESMSWGGYWMTVIFGGINMQIEHHLAPALDPPLLWFMADGLRKICKEHNVQYTHEPSLFHAMVSLHRRLWMMGIDTK
ncbi:Fad4 [Symbiodinium sp. CCMP2456]|nr:Fad4 [Symbiodinium sp. CCMP2456]